MSTVRNCFPLALLALSCIGGNELRGKAARDSQLESVAAADLSPADLPRVWRPARDPAWGDARADRGTQNLFAQLLGKSDSEVDEKVGTAVHRFFGIGTDEPNQLIRDSGYRSYYQLPQDPTLAFIWAADSNDVRSEGMSYGMMLAVQSDVQPEFDRLWKFAHTYMQYASDSPFTAWRHYFRWQGVVRAESPQTWSVKFGADTSRLPTARSTSPRRSTWRTAAGAARARSTIAMRPPRSPGPCCTTARAVMGAFQ